MYFRFHKWTSELVVYCQTKLFRSLNYYFYFDYTSQVLRLMKEHKQWRESFPKTSFLRTIVLVFLSSIIAEFFSGNLEESYEVFFFSPTCSLMYGQSISFAALVADRWNRLNYYVLGCRPITLFEEEAKSARGSLCL